jgi:hypothetical protein
LLFFNENAINKVKRNKSPDNTIISPFEITTSFTRKKSRVAKINIEKPAVRIRKVLLFISVVIARARDRQRAKLRKTLIPKIILKSSEPIKMPGRRINPYDNKAARRTAKVNIT